MTILTDEKLATVRANMPTVATAAYFNTGTAGPLAQVTLDALAAGDAFDAEIGRGSGASFAPFLEASAQLRAAFARLTGATAAEIALTHHTTEGMNIVTHGLNWQRGDEIVLLNFEHPGGIVPVYIVARRYGVEVRMVHLAFDDGPEAIVAKIAAALSPRTRLLVFSHVAWNTGVRLPMEEIVALARRHSVLTLVDAAQSIGALPLDMPASGVDFYAMTSQKWLCGPEGVGALYVRRDRLDRLHPTFGGYLTLAMPNGHDLTGWMLPQPDARRYETGTVYRPGIKAMVANLHWLEQEVGWPWIHARIAALTDYARAALARVPGLQIVTPAGPQAGLLTFTLAGYEPPRVMLALAAAGIIVRYINFPLALRASLGFYNTEGEVDRLADELTAVTRRSPEELPIYVNPFA